MHILLLPFLLVSLGVAFFNTAWGVGVFFCVFGLFELYVWAMDCLGRPKVEPYTNPMGFGVDEARIFSKYHLFFKYPSACSGFSGLLSAVQLSTLIWVPLLLFRHFWVAAAIIAVNWYLAGWLAMRLNPARFLNDMVKKGHTVMAADLSAFNSVCEQIYETPNKPSGDDG